MPVATLPVPPSLHDLYVEGYNRRTGRKAKFRSKKYEVWSTEAVLRYKTTFRRYAKDEPVSLIVFIHGGEGFNEARDLDNCWKPIKDALVNAGIVHDDKVRYIRRESIEFVPAEPTPKGKPRPKSKMTVEVVPYVA